MADLVMTFRHFAKRSQENVGRRQQGQATRSHLLDFAPWSLKLQFGLRAAAGRSRLMSWYEAGARFRSKFSPQSNWVGACARCASGENSLHNSMPTNVTNCAFR